MSTECLSIGPVYTLEQNVVYALPTCAVRIWVGTACQVSNDFAFSASGAVSANASAAVCGGWIRCTTTNTLARMTRE